MLWQGRRQSSNVEDRRGISPGGLAVGGGVIGIIAIIINLLFGGGDVSQLPDLLPGQQSQPMSQQEQAADDERAQFVKVVLAETEDVWNNIFQQRLQRDYAEPTLVLFRNLVQSGCGNASAASGPFYCPSDQKLYIDLSFYEELQSRFNAPGDFAMAYVVAHEVGHHVQNMLGTAQQVARARETMSESEFNKMSVKLELQADFFAGVWAHFANRAKILEQGDIEEALNAANAIGDDRLQRQTQGTVVPDAFTHGTSEQRMFWFKKGFDTGDPSQGDTFSDPSLADANY